MSEYIRPGMHVECRDAFGKWWPAAAVTAPRQDHANKVGRGPARVTVSVFMPQHGHPINWPVEAVRVRHAVPDPPGWIEEEMARLLGEACGE